MNTEIKLYTKNEYQVVNKYNLIVLLNMFNINSIQVKDNNLVNVNNTVAKMVYTDKEHPFIIYTNKYGNTLYVNSEYYQENVGETIEILKSVIRNNKGDSFSIEDNCLINDDIIDEIIKNKSIKNVSFTKYNKEDYYILTKKDYLKFKNANIKIDTKEVSEELKDTFDDIIVCNSTKKLLGEYNYNDLKQKRNIVIMSDLTDKELENFKYINKDTKVIFFPDSLNKKNIFKYLDRLNEVGVQKYVINVIDKEVFNKIILDIDINNYKNLTVRLNYLDEINIRDYINFEKILYLMIEPAMNLSPLEKYIYAYNITKKFKVYKENDYHRSEARDLYSILINEYMVCVGYRNLLGDLLNKLGIPNIDLSVSVDTSYDKVKNDEVDVNDIIPVNKNGHARKYVYINDTKYGIDGYYVSDPTWDNSISNDNYIHMLMTDSEISGSSRYTWSSGMDMFGSKDMNEYYDIVRNVFKHKDYSDFIFFIKARIDDIRKLDINSYNYLVEKYNYIELISSKWPNDCSDLIYDIGEIIIKHNNNVISGETLFRGIREIYLKTYGYTEDNVDLELEKVREHNMNLYSYHFPIRKKIDKNENEEIIMNGVNKFDFDLLSKTL